MLPLGAVVLLSAGFAWRSWEGPVVRLQTLEPRDLVRTVVASARVQAPHSVELGAQVTGTVRQVLVEEGQAVQAGQALVALEATEAQATWQAADLAVQQAAARLRQLQEVQAPAARESERQAEANLAQIRAQHARQQDLFRQGFIGQAALDEARRALQVAEAQARAATLQRQSGDPQGADLALARTTLEQARASALAARARLDYLSIKAPVAGTIVNRSVEPGQVVQAGKVLLLLAPAGASELVAQIDERNLGLLQPGQAALASADAYADQRFEARLSEVSPGVDAQRGSVEVKLAVPKPPAYLRQDMTVSVEIEVARRPQVLSLPLEAVVQADSAQPFAWVLDAQDRLQRRELRLGLRAGGVVEVQQGLKAGERVLLAPDRRWKAGQHLRQAGA
ncbi:efflux RND transporter periplasmic adaptor subunit [Pelomonas sp. APW6]|uniref:Efflux RND transporter periplasmic adaptor subunit n=1 Tax=Roseateles subflavus TaxID=3053353 RepID=A0ABT7LES3_9BURK|nr:efflux RND transporter periplasmic adaptor subunit [Pelomonas sp. APW6]MDL5031354.1 efflux RND transporter periplasmic adaptor subunit [Pelomonas sp. APW6]